ncbi:MAG: enoyl-CoA hydratase/isomerase family protein, partial [Candidatus Zixiibacteriota bacterium]
MNYTTIKYEKRDRVGRVTFCRPEVHNAFNSTLIKEMLHLFGAIESDEQLRLVVLTGEGKSFCAG